MEPDGAAVRVRHLRTEVTRPSVLGPSRERPATPDATARRHRCSSTQLLPTLGDDGDGDPCGVVDVRIGPRHARLFKEPCELLFSANGDVGGDREFFHGSIDSRGELVVLPPLLRRFHALI